MDRCAASEDSRAAVRIRSTLAGVGHPFKGSPSLIPTIGRYSGTFYGATRADVREKLTRALGEVQRGGFVDADERVTVGAYLDHWLATLSVRRKTVRAIAIRRLALEARARTHPAHETDAVAVRLAVNRDVSRETPRRSLKSFRENWSRRPDLNR